MRIISGTVKGRKLIAPPARQGKTIRPTSDRAREALFSIIGQRIIHSDMLDLYAGTGAVGLEAFSRGANNVFFVEKNKIALQILQRNISLCLGNRKNVSTIKVIRHDLTHSLPTGKLSSLHPRGFDIIFSDPPYSSNYSLKSLLMLDKSNLLSNNGLLIIEERCNVSLPTELSFLRLFDRRVYGEASFWFYKPNLMQSEKI
ncbi:methyltransferase small [Desulfomarina profundi]|uniref:Methyltransferase small n=1 Tax=Desulfomarina profundi TaxID=2772557 RepID=A0A8D5FGY3_9BACT|nr:16S rRNA (guanine(966)-N(2))-methyltransferase RsmD [Desulfomarina profundi]BCL60436.1 methyltransferase small [Desulfomarina profundi]